MCLDEWSIDNIQNFHGNRQILAAKRELKMPPGHPKWELKRPSDSRNINKSVSVPENYMEAKIN